MSVTLTQPTIGSTNWGAAVNTNWQTIQDALNQNSPAGMIIAFAGTAAPTGYLACDGSAVSRTIYVALFTAISTTWGAGDGSTTFNVPDLRRRTLVGQGGVAISGPGTAVGNTGGEEAHTLLLAEIPSHSHGSGWKHHYASGGSCCAIRSQYDSQWGEDSTEWQGESKGGGGSHNTMQPSAVVMYCIKT